MNISSKLENAIVWPIILTSPVIILLHPTFIVLVSCLVALFGAAYIICTNEQEIKKIDWSDEGIKKALYPVVPDIIDRKIYANSELIISNKSDILSIYEFKVVARKHIICPATLIDCYIFHYSLATKLIVSLNHPNFIKSDTKYAHILYLESIKAINKIYDYINTSGHRSEAYNINSLKSITHQYDTMKKSHDLEKFIQHMRMHNIRVTIDSGDKKPVKNKKEKIVARKNIQDTIDKIIDYHTELQTDTSKKLIEQVKRLVQAHDSVSPQHEKYVKDMINKILKYLESEYNRTKNVNHPMYLKDKLEESDRYIKSVIQNDNWVE